MATTPATTKKPAKAPPDERFWKKYSPHYELPISSATSIVLHALLLTLLVLGGVIAAKLGLSRDHTLPSAEPIIISGGGGNKQGVGTGPNTGILPAGKEAVEQPKEPQVANAEPPREDLKDVQPKKQTLLDPKETSDASRVVAQADAVLGQLSKTGEAAKKKIDGLIAGKGRGGTGEGGGQGKGKGTGTGDLEGPGRGNIQTKREKRQLRWTMIFNTRDGGDYLRQLQALGAILAVPGEDGRYRVIEDLKRRPVELVEKDLGELNRIYWVDDRPQSVRSLAQALGMSFQPSHVAAFFPERLEKELLDKELAYMKRRHPGRTEDDIDGTRFQVLPRGNTYEPTVVDQTMKR